jgi:hypothetical protein
MNTFKRAFAILAVVASLAIVPARAANVYIETTRAHSAVGAFGCTVSGATVATPSVITCSAAHGLIDGDQIQVTGIVGTTTDNTTAYAKVTSYSTTTFALYQDAGLTTGVTGTGAYTSGGKVSKAQDISGLAGDATIHIAVNSQTAAQSALICIQDSADGFVSDIVSVWCVNTTGGTATGFAIPPNWYSKRLYEIPSLRIGVSNAKLRLSVTSLSGGSVNTSLFIEQ